MIPFPFFQRVSRGLCGLLLVLGPAAVRSQTPPMEWGDVRPGDVGGTVFRADTGASAVILCEYGESSIDDDLNVVFKYHVRIRILSPTGYIWGSHAAVVNEKDDLETIDDIAGVTYTGGPDSAIVRHDMASDAIFREELEDGLVRYRFTLPALSPGCVIEYRYRIVSRSWFLVRNWFFQTSEPVLWSEYRLRHPQQIGYVTVNSGYEPFAVQEKRIVDHAAFADSRLASYIQSPMARMVVMRWAVKNAPAVRKEPFITTTKDYKNRVDIQLAGYADPPHGVKRFLHDWETVVHDLAVQKSFGASIDVSASIRRQAQSLTRGITGELERVRAIYNWVDTSLVYTGVGWSVNNVDEVLERKSGTNSEIAVLFLSLLKSIGIDGQLVIASSRSNGLIQELYPIVSQFDEVLTRVMVGSRPLYLAPTDPLRPMELLPVDLLGVKGLVIQERGVDWVTLASDRQSVRRTMATLAIKEDGSVDGWFEGTQSDYAALRMRRFAQDKTPHDIAMKFFDLEEGDATIDSVNIEGLNETDRPLRVHARVSALSGVSRVGDKIYAMPMVINRVKENPLKLENRRFPVEFAYPWQQTTVVTLRLPPGYTMLDSLPERTIMVGNGDMLLKRRFQVDSGTVAMRVQFDARTSRFEPRVYKELRDVYGKVVAVQGEQIVVGKRPLAAPSPQPLPAKPLKTKKRQR